MVPASRAERAALALVVVAGVVARLAWAAYAARPPVGLHDPALYRYLANSLADGNGYRYGDGPTAYYPVGYPAALGAVMKVLRATPLPDSATVAAVVLSTLASAVAIVATYGLARRWLSHRRALAAAAVVALLPSLVFHGAVVMGETFFLALLVPALVLLVGERPSARHLVAAGLLLGAATLTRPVVLPLLLVLPLLWKTAGADRATVLRRAGVVAGVVVAVVLPWVIRNAAVMGSATLSTNTGDNLCMSRQPGATGSFVLSDYCSGDDGITEARPASEVRRDTKGRTLAIDFVRDHPATEVSLWPRRVIATFTSDADALFVAESFGDDPFIPAGFRDVLKAGATVVFLALLAATVVASRWWWREERAGFVLLAVGFAAVVLVPVLVFFGDPRFHLPGVPMLAVLAAGLPRPRPRPARA